jgi:antagonist of KipI
VGGGIDVPPVLGSASTHLLTGLGGFEGRALKRGDVLRAKWGGHPRLRRVSRPVPPSLPPIHVTSPSDAYALCATAWEVLQDSDRMGLRLRGPSLDRHTGHMLTEGVPLGAIQVPPDGQPIILFVEHQTTGGYPKIANVISADFHAVGQLRPRDPVRFEQISIEAALQLFEAQEEWLHSLA